MPSPMSGTFTMWTLMSKPAGIAHSSLDLQHAPERGADTVRSGKIGPLLRVRIRRVPSRDALDRRLPIEETMLLNERPQLRAETPGAGGFVGDHAAAGLLH